MHYLEEWELPHMNDPKVGAYSYIVHDLYGCESGCCGHALYLCNLKGDIIKSQWIFSHPYGEDKNIWAEQMCRAEWNVPVRLDLCKVSDD